MAGILLEESNNKNQKHESPIISSNMGHYEDSRGRNFELTRGYRDKIVPRWPAMFEKKSEYRGISSDDIERTQNNINKTITFLELHGFDMNRAHVLEVGCHYGLAACEMAKRGGNVTAIDIPDYGVRQSFDQETSEQNLREQSKRLRDAREANVLAYEKYYSCNIHGRLGFRDQDIAELKEENSYDLVVSWETLEHVTLPEKALKNMYHALKPGGYCFHEYNPFFCENGGHSLCTLDFPFGHVRLAANDFIDYIGKIRPSEKRIAVNFYEKSLNRMTLTELNQYARGAGFEKIEIIPWANVGLLRSISREILMQCQDNYPGLVLQDLISPSVWALMRRPG